MGHQRLVTVDHMYPRKVLTCSASLTEDGKQLTINFLLMSGEVVHTCVADTDITVGELRAEAARSDPTSNGTRPEHYCLVADISGVVVAKAREYTNLAGSHGHVDWVRHEAEPARPFLICGARQAVTDGKDITPTPMVSQNK